MFSLARISPSIPAAMKSSMIKESFFHCGFRLVVLSSIKKLFSLMNFHVCEIQEDGTQWYRSGRLFEKIFTEHPIYFL